MAPHYTAAAEDRERLILECIPKVRWIASVIAERLPPSVAEEDLVSAGLVGLIQAVDNYDPSRNASLWTYAEYKIRGAILDSVRGLDGISPQKRKRLKIVQEAVAAVERRVNRSAAEDEIAAQLGIPMAEYREWLLELRGVTLDSLDAPSGDGPAATARQVADVTAESPAAAYERAELQARLARAVAQLPQIERTVLHLYFEQELTLVEIGEVVGLHYSRVSQLKTQAIVRLRASMQHRKGSR